MSERTKLVEIDKNFVYNQIIEIISKEFNFKFLDIKPEWHIEHNNLESIYNDIIYNEKRDNLRDRLTTLFDNYIDSVKNIKESFFPPYASYVPLIKYFNCNGINIRLLASHDIQRDGYIISLDTLIQKKEMNKKEENLHVAFIKPEELTISKDEYLKLGIDMSRKDTSIKKEEFHQFKTGAIRSSDCNDLCYSLISPIGLLAVAKIANKMLLNNTHPICLLNKALEYKYEFFSGNKNPELFAYSAFFIMNAIQNKDVKKWNKHFGKLDTEDEVRFDLLPYEGLKALAQRYSLGEKKYKKYNWERGMDILSLQDHGVEHIRKHMNGDTSDDNLAAAVWSDIASIHSWICWPELNLLLRDEGCKLNQNILNYLENKEIMKEKNE